MRSGSSRVCEADALPVQANDAAREVPWRPGYRTFVLAGKEHGVGCSASLSVLEPGAGAPLHFHPDVDEILTVRWCAGS